MGKMPVVHFMPRAGSASQGPLLTLHGQGAGATPAHAGESSVVPLTRLGEAPVLQARGFAASVLGPAPEENAITITILYLSDPI